VREIERQSRHIVSVRGYECVSVLRHAGAGGCGRRLDARWLQLTRALAGLLCASFQSVDHTVTTWPQLSFAPMAAHGTCRYRIPMCNFVPMCVCHCTCVCVCACVRMCMCMCVCVLLSVPVPMPVLKLTVRIHGPDGVLRYALLPHESVCAENMTPFLQLLPCHVHAGLATLWAGKHLYDADYAQLGLHLFPTVRTRQPALCV
jgi:hypothetical protein